MKRSRLGHVAVLIAIMAASRSVSEGCSCIGSSTPTQALDKAAAVFTGYAVAVNIASKWAPTSAARSEDCALEVAQEGAMSVLCLGGEVTVTLEVTAAWKGVTTGRVEVRTPAQGSACGFPFRVGQSYLVYAYRQGGSGPLATDTCQRTKGNADASVDREALGLPSIDRFTVESQKGGKPKP